MASSLILQGGAAVAKTLKESATQASHGFIVGDVIRWNGALVPPKYVNAIADTAQNAEVAGDMLFKISTATTKTIGNPL